MKYIAYAIPLFMAMPVLIWILIQNFLVKGNANNWLSGNLWEVALGLAVMLAAGLAVAHLIVSAPRK